MAATTHTGFFYGTLMAPPVLHRVISGTSTPTPAQRDRLTIIPAVLPGYHRHRVRGADYPCILPVAAERSPADLDARGVRGTLVRGLTARDLALLDVFEGDEYARTAVRVRVLGAGEVGEMVEAETYVFVGGVERVEAGEWDFEAFVRERMGRWVGKEVEEGIADVDKHVQAEDPTGGRMMNGAITRALEESREKAEISPEEP